MARAAIPDCRHWQVTRDNDNILWLYLDRQGESVNALGREVLEEFDALITLAERDTPLGLAILSGKSGGFIYGADVREFDGFDDADSVKAEISRVHDMFDRLEALPCPTVAAIRGYCLGGGLELALACDYRIAQDTPDTKFGFPETQLGIYPGFGGSARSIARVGGLKAMELMLTARNINARAALGIGLVDEVINRHGALNWAARRAILKSRHSRPPRLTARMTSQWPLRPLLARQMRKQTASRVRPEHYPAPFSLIENWRRIGANRKRLQQVEIDTVSRLMVTPAADGLRRVFRLMERLKAEGRKSDFSARRVHVVGAGVMGGDIAAWCVLKGMEVSLQDQSQEQIGRALKNAEKLLRRKLRDPQRVKSAMARLRPDVEGTRVAFADVVIEAIVENAQAKQELFRRMEPKLQRHTVLATNTSAIPLETLAEALEKPTRLVGLHFFNPVAKMPLVEVVGGQHSSPDMMKKAASFCSQIDRFPLPVRSSPGFLVNRVLAPYMMKALQIMQEGTPAEAIDRAAELFGMPMGPVELADTVGLDVCLMVTEVLGDEQTKDSEEARFIRSHVDQGRLGKKSGSGLYHWKDGKPVKEPRHTVGHDFRILAERLVHAYTEECRAALEEGIVGDEELLDAGMVFGTGFAPFRGGPMYYLAHQHEQFEVESPAFVQSNDHQTASTGSTS